MRSINWKWIASEGPLYGLMFAGYFLFIKPASTAFFEGDPISFQRTGSMLIAITIVWYALQRNRLRYLQRSVDEARLPEVVELEGEIDRLADDITSFWEKKAETDSVPTASERLNLEEKTKQFRKKYDLKAALEQHSDYVRDLARSTVNKSILIEIFLLVIGTLMWGYGDLFVCWYHSGEWKC